MKGRKEGKKERKRKKGGREEFLLLGYSQMLEAVEAGPGWWQHLECSPDLPHGRGHRHTWALRVALQGCTIAGSWDQEGAGILIWIINRYLPQHHLKCHLLESWGWSLLSEKAFLRRFLSNLKKYHLYLPEPPPLIPVSLFYFYLCLFLDLLSSLPSFIS